MVKAHRRLWAVPITICTILGIVFFAVGLGLAVLTGKGMAVNTGTNPQGSLAIVRKVPAMDIQVHDRILVPDATVDAWDAAEVVSVTATGNSKAIYTLIPVNEAVQVPGNYLARWTDMILWSASGLGAIAPLLSSPVLIGVGVVLLAASVWGIYSLRRRGRGTRPAKSSAAAPAGTEATQNLASSAPELSTELPEPALVAATPATSPVEAPASAPNVAAAPAGPYAPAVPSEPLQLPIGVEPTPHEAFAEPVSAAIPVIPLNPVDRRADRWMPESYLTPQGRADSLEDQPATPAVHIPSRPASAMPVDVPDEMWDEVWSDAAPQPAAPSESHVLPSTYATPDAAAAAAGWPSAHPAATSWSIPDDVFDPQVTWGTGEMEAVDPHVTWTGAAAAIQPEDYPWPPAEAAAPASPEIQWPTVPSGGWLPDPSAALSAAWVSQPEETPQVVAEPAPAPVEDVYATAVDDTYAPAAADPAAAPATDVFAASPYSATVSSPYTWEPTEETLLAAEPAAPLDLSRPEPEPEPAMASASVEARGQQPGAFGYAVCEHVGIAWPLKAGLRAAGLTGAPATRVVPLHTPAPRPQETRPMFEPRRGQHASAAAAPVAPVAGPYSDLEVLPSRRSLREHVA